MTINEKLQYLLDHGFELYRASTIVNTNKLVNSHNPELTLQAIDHEAWDTTTKPVTQKRLYQLILHANNSDKHLSYNSQWFFKPSLYHEIQNAYKFLSKYY